MKHKNKTAKQSVHDMWGDGTEETQHMIDSLLSLASIVDRELNTDKYQALQRTIESSKEVSELNIRQHQINQKRVKTLKGKIQKFISADRTDREVVLFNVINRLLISLSCELGNGQVDEQDYLNAFQDFV